MSNFLWNDTAVPNGKVGPTSSSPSKVSSAEWNGVMQDLEDLRTSYLNGEMRPNPRGATAVSPSGAYRFRSLDDGTTQISEGGGMFRRVRMGGLFDISDYSGANPMGTGDSTSALQAAMTAAAADHASGSGVNVGQVYIPPGRWRITSLLALHGRPGIRVFGAGRRSSVLYWDGTNGADVFLYENMQHWLFENFSIEFNPAKTAGIVFNSYHGTVSGNAITACAIRDVTINSITGAGHFTKAFATTGIDTNNSEFHFENVQSFATGSETEAHYSFESRQARAQVFLNVSIYGGKRGVATCLGTGDNAGQGGDFCFFGGGVGGVSKAGFDLGGVNARISIDGCTSESVHRFLQNWDVDTLGRTQPPANLSFPVSIRNCLISTDTIASDQLIIAYSAAGPLIIEGNNIGNGNATPGRIGLATGNAGFRASIKNNSFLAAGSAYVDPVDYITDYSIIKVGVDVQNNVFLNNGMNVIGVAERANVRPDSSGTWAMTRSGPDGRQRFVLELPRTVLKANATSQVVQLPALPSHAQIRKCVAFLYDAFAGAGTTTLRVGTTSGGQEILLDSAIDYATLQTNQTAIGFSPDDVGPALAGVGANGSYSELSYGSSGPTLYVKVTGATNLGNGTTTNLTGGRLQIHVELDVWEGNPT